VNNSPFSISTEEGVFVVISQEKTWVKFWLDQW